MMQLLIWQIDKKKMFPIVKISWIPRIGPKSFRKHNVKVEFTAGPNLKDILCQLKCPLPKNSYPGVYRLECNCGNTYIGKTKKKVSTRIRQHELAFLANKYICHTLDRYIFLFTATRFNLVLSPEIIYYLQAYIFRIIIHHFVHIK